MIMRGFSKRDVRVAGLVVAAMTLLGACNFAHAGGIGGRGSTVTLAQADPSGGGSSRSTRLPRGVIKLAIGGVILLGAGAKWAIGKMGTGSSKQDGTPRT